ncbi:bcl-2-binding component 3, isoforms 3/4-like [Nycticebus coucang]|uniref:bcl-2-binding component 3, isoforms 3/4-like n=1 Tax=Nycticebus coucang TaxID=9470 RepID=UPI00234D835C|nr:bcl-2-binding component 3, isoforms 3/4-like [Nycticebus coucang]
MAAGAVTWRGQRARLLSDLYGSPGRTGAAEREAGRVSARAAIAAQPGFSFTVFFVCSAFASCRAARDLMEGRRERAAWALPGSVPRGAGARGRPCGTCPGLAGAESRAGGGTGHLAGRPAPTPGAGGAAPRRGRGPERATRGGAVRRLSGAVQPQLASRALSLPIFWPERPREARSPRGRGAAVLSAGPSTPFSERPLTWELPRPPPRRAEFAGSAGRGGGSGRGGEGTAAAEDEERRGPAPPDTRALAEVVVCAVGRAVTLPAVEITAQATALLVLVMLSAPRTMAGNPLCLRGRGDSPLPRKPLVSRRPGASGHGDSRTATRWERGLELSVGAAGSGRAGCCDMPTHNLAPE